MTKINSNGKSEKKGELEVLQVPVYSGKLKIFKKIQCTLWKFNNEKSTPEFIARRKVRYGKRTFKWNGQVYNIDYNVLKRGKKYFEFDCDVDNAIGGMSFVKNKDSITPNQLDEFMEALGENVFTARRGIPAMVLYIAMIVALIGVGGMAYFAMEYVKYSEALPQLQQQNNALRAQVTNLQNQINGVEINAN